MTVTMADILVSSLDRQIEKHSRYSSLQPRQTDWQAQQIFQSPADTDRLTTTADILNTSLDR